MKEQTRRNKDQNKHGETKTEKYRKSNMEKLINTGKRERSNIKTQTRRNMEKNNHREAWESKHGEISKIKTWRNECGRT